MKTYSSACPLNCWDTCAFLVEIKEGQVIQIKPDPRQEITDNFLCSKGRRFLELINHPERLTTPLRKVNGQWEKICWEDALNLFAEKLITTLDTYGSHSVLHYFDAGNGGILKGLDQRFFSSLGGVTQHVGSLCWNAGLEAQKYDLGKVMAHSYTDLVNSQLIILWGRNPADTAPHQLPYIKEAYKLGTRVVVVDPVKTRTCQWSHQHIAIRPGTDGALALGMARVILKEELFHQEFVEEQSRGFEQFCRLVNAYTPERVSEITGIPPGELITLARDYAKNTPAAILMGYGLQRYANGGNTVRAIDALAAMTGNLGVSGGGANYANFQSGSSFDYQLLTGKDLNPAPRFYQKPQLARYLEEAKDPPVKMMVAARGNPLTQMGNTSALLKTLSQLDFMVTIDLVFNDTAQYSDLVLPCTSFLEEENLVFTSMGHTYLNYTPRLVDPQGESRTELSLYTELATKLGVEGFPSRTPDEWLKKLLRPLTEQSGITLEMLKEGPVKYPFAREVPWAEWRFETSDSKFHFYSSLAEKEGLDPLPEYRPRGEIFDSALKKKGFDLFLITPHPRWSIHSLHYALERELLLPQVHLHPETASSRGLQEGEEVLVSSPRSTISGVLKFWNGLRQDTVVIYEGHWERHGGPVNLLTSDALADMGGQAALYDCLCTVSRSQDPTKISLSKDE